MFRFLGSVLTIVLFLAAMFLSASSREAKENEKLEKIVKLLDSSYSYDKAIHKLQEYEHFSSEQRKLVLATLIPKLRVKTTDGFVVEFMYPESKILTPLNAHQELIDELFNGSQENHHRLGVIFCLTYFELKKILSKEEQTKLYNYLHKTTWAEIHEEDFLSYQLQTHSAALMAKLNDISEEEIQKLSNSHPNQTIRGGAPYYIR